MRIEWTDELVEHIKHLWQNGKSAAQIAYMISTPDVTVSRNAVIGKLQRVGCNKEGRKYKHPPRDRTGYRKVVRATPQLAPVRVTIEPAPQEEPEPVPMPDIDLDLDDEDYPIPKRVRAVLALTYTTCRWPIDDQFCYAECSVNKPYCEHHTQEARRDNVRYEER